MKNAVMVIIIAMVFSGCAGGQSYDYSIVPINVNADGGNKKIALGVHDQRVYVKNGEKYPQWVGTQRSPAYVPWNINTKTGASMADDFMLSIGSSLRTRGFNVSAISLPERVDTDQAIILLMKTGNKKLLLFTINEWYFDVYFRVRMSCSMKLEVFDGKGGLLASAEVKKEMWNDGQNAIPDQEFQSAVEQLLNNEKIVNSLEQDVNLSDTEEEMKCTTDQILKMKELGMTNNQIKAACQ